jgi:hypothetical protein
MVNSRSAKWSRNSFVAMLILFAINYSEWPFKIGFDDWRAEAWTSWLLSLALWCVFVWFGWTRKNNPLRYITTLIGSLLLVPIILSLVMLYLPILSDQSIHDVELLQAVPSGVLHYRLYAHNSEGVGTLGYASLRQELDTPLGFKLVRTVWASTYHCCTVKLDVSDQSDIKIVDSRNGKTIVAIRR